MESQRAKKKKTNVDVLSNTKSLIHLYIYNLFIYRGQAGLSNNLYDPCSTQNLIRPTLFGLGSAIPN